MLFNDNEGSSDHADADTADSTQGISESLNAISRFVQSTIGSVSQNAKDKFYDYFVTPAISTYVLSQYDRVGVVYNSLVNGGLISRYDRWLEGDHVRKEYEHQFLSTWKKVRKSDQANHEDFLIDCTEDDLKKFKFLDFPPSYQAKGTYNGEEEQFLGSHRYFLDERAILRHPTLEWPNKIHIPGRPEPIPNGAHSDTLLIESK